MILYPFKKHLRRSGIVSLALLTSLAILNPIQTFASSTDKPPKKTSIKAPAKAAAQPDSGIIKLVEGSGCMVVDFNAGRRGGSFNVAGSKDCSDRAASRWYLSAKKTLAVKRGSKNYCLTLDFAESGGVGGEGRNLIASPNCSEGAHQIFAFEGKGFIVNYTDGVRACVDVQADAVVGSDGKGRNIIAWRNCHGGVNQVWKRIQ